MSKNIKKKVVVIGGGTGTYTVLTGLKKFPQLDLSVIVSMMDSGGSNRVIRDEFGLLPTSDIRQCVVALSKKKPNELLRKLFTYRYSAGTGISGMTFGNLFMAALTDIYGSQEKAIERTCEFLGVKGKIIPVTYDNTNLVALYDNGKQVLGEHAIDEPDGNLGEHRIVELSVFPKAKANPAAIKEISLADMIIIGPGDLYTSVLSNIVVDGIAESVINSKAKLLFVINLMTRWGQTNHYKASDFLAEIKKYLFKYPDYVLVNNRKIPSRAVSWYKNVKSEPVNDDIKSTLDMKVIRGNFIHSKYYHKNISDKLTRSLIRHDSSSLAEAIFSLL